MTLEKALAEFRGLEKISEGEYVKSLDGIEPPHRLLPPDAIAILQRAARSEGTAMQRRKAMEDAEKRVRQMYPQFFKGPTT
jgi:hypothetical protein